MRKLVACVCFLALLGLQARAASISGESASLSLALEDHDIQARLSSRGMVNFAAGPYVWQATIDGAEHDGLQGPQIKMLDQQTLMVTGNLGPLEVEQRFTLLESSNGFSEVISLHNPTGKEVDINAIRTGFTRRITPSTDPYRLVAVPYRRQTDGSLHDDSMADAAALMESQQKLNPTCSGWPPKAPLADDLHRRLRSESWILTDGTNSLLVLKYNNQAIEHSAVNWIVEQQRLVFGGCAYVLHKEPVQVNHIQAGGTFRFGETRYEFYQGGWPEGYTIYKAFMNRHGHGLTAEYQPQVQWNVLFDLNRPGGGPRWPLEKVLQEADWAKEVGCTRMYFDPGWQVPYPKYPALALLGSALWDEKRLGPVKQMVKLLKDSYGLELGLWTASRCMRDGQWPEKYYRKVPLATQKAPRIDNGHRNLALLAEAKANASSLTTRGSINLTYQIPHLNDGIYGDTSSWIAGKMPAWAEIDLGGEYTISEVALSNDNTQKEIDRGTTSFRILTATEYNANSQADSWKVAAEYRQYEAALNTRMSFSFRPVSARWVRIELLAPLNTPVRLDEIEVYEYAETNAAAAEIADMPKGESFQTLNELCMSDKDWLAERYRRLSKLTDAGVTFLMFDFHGWRGPCYAPDHGHPVPSTTIDHVDSIYGLARKLRERNPGLQIEMHDAIWPWGCRYLPSYFRQGLTNGDYDENWAYEFMWNTIEDLRSGRAICLYYYSLAYDIPLYLHFNMVADNDQSLAFWWMASTIRHIGIGGRTDAAHKRPHGPIKELTPAQKAERFEQYKAAMATYNRLKRYFTHGAFIGIGGDETLHLHTLPDHSGGVLLVFNLSKEPVTRTVRVPLIQLKLKPTALPVITGATGSVEGDHLLLTLELGPESPAVIEIGTTPASEQTEKK